MVKINKRLILILLLAVIITACKPFQKTPSTIRVAVRGDVEKKLNLSSEDLRKFPEMTLNNVLLLEEKSECATPERVVGVYNFQGVLLRDILSAAGMKHKRKFEPGVFVRVIGDNNREVIFSFGEIFYSSIGRSALFALKKDNMPVDSASGFGELVVSTDIRNGRNIKSIREIRVERVGTEMLVYEDQKKNIVRPPTTQFTVTDHNTQKQTVIKLEDLQAMPSIKVKDAVMVGDCEGFRGVFSFEGPSLKSILTHLGFSECNIDFKRYVVASSENGFSATYSFGEIFNSRLSDNIVVAYLMDNALLDEGNGFARMAVREDSTGGRSVRRVHVLEIY